DERHWTEPGHVRQHFGPSWQHHADLAVRDALRFPDPRYDRRDADRRGIRIVEGPTQALHRMALSPRYHEGAARRRRHRSYACDLLHRAGDRAQGDSSVPL